MKYLRSMLVALVVAALAACASAPDKPSHRLLAYEAASGAPVNSFRYFSLWSWEPLDRDRLAIYTRGNEAYLLTVDGGCRNLLFATAIGLTSLMHEVTIRFDKVLAGGNYPCTIMEIRPVDVQKLKAEERLQKERKIDEKERAASP
ncbi:MAG TPA: DUF6491 family protein [Dyella sp.]|uniref:DUF6491 family protein n=1 Tax=Dyella sp. TaxID=1869338 RepID=UPI002F93EADE